METLGAWLENDWLPALVVEYSFFWPLCEVLHFIGLALLIGTVGILDLRMMGVAKQLPIGPIQRLIPWGVLGFVLCLLTGLVFVAGEPFRAPILMLRNLSFQLKMLCVGLAGLNVLVFYVTGLARKVDALQPGEKAPTGARVIAVVSLVLWIGVMYFGRMLPWSDAIYMLFNPPEAL